MGDRAKKKPFEDYFMKKPMWTILASGLLAVGMMSCGSDSNSGNNNGLYGQNNPYQQQCSAGQIYAYPHGCVSQGNCPIGQALVNNQCQVIQQNPGQPIMSNTVMCAQGQMRLKNQCFQTTNLQQACGWAGGQYLQTGLCRTERRLPMPIKRTYMQIGRFQDVIPVTVSLNPGELLKISGNLHSRKNKNDWELYVLQNGETVAHASSQGGGSIVSESNDNVSIIVYAQQPMMNGYPNTQPYPNQQYPNQQMVPQQSYAMPSSYSLGIVGRGTLYVDLKGSAIACENGLGNTYPCN